MKQQLALSPGPCLWLRTVVDSKTPSPALWFTITIPFGFDVNMQATDATFKKSTKQLESFYNTENRNQKKIATLVEMQDFFKELKFLTICYKNIISMDKKYHSFYKYDSKQQTCWFLSNEAHTSASSEL